MGVTEGNCGKLGWTGDTRDNMKARDQPTDSNRQKNRKRQKSNQRHWPLLAPSEKAVSICTADRCHHPYAIQVFFTSTSLFFTVFCFWCGFFFFFCIACFNIFIIIILRPHLAIIIHTYVKKPNTPTVKHWAVPVNSSALRTRRLCHFCHLFQSTNIFF